MSDSEDRLLSHLTILDDFIQVIYQGHLKFVVLSQADEDIGWTVHVGLTSKTGEGRWWKGQWSEKDVEKILGSRTASSLVEAFAQKLRDAFVGGDIFIGNWNSAARAEINLTLGTAEKRPLSVPLTELSPQEAAAYASDVFFRIALQAQKRGCQLEPANAPAPAALPLPSYEPRRATAITNNAQESSPKSTSTDARSSTSTSSGSKLSNDSEAAKEIQVLKSKLAQAKAEKVQGSKSKPSNPLEARMKARGVATTRPPKGASLANPNKRARKIKELEFEDDD